MWLAKAQAQGAKIEVLQLQAYFSSGSTTISGESPLLRVPVLLSGLSTTVELFLGDARL